MVVVQADACCVTAVTIPDGMFCIKVAEYKIFRWQICDFG